MALRNADWYKCKRRFDEDRTELRLRNLSWRYCTIKLEHKADYQKSWVGLVRNWFWFRIHFLFVYRVVWGAQLYLEDKWVKPLKTLNFGSEQSRMSTAKTTASTGLLWHIVIWQTFFWHIFPSLGALAGQNIPFPTNQIQTRQILSTECHGIDFVAQSLSTLSRQVTSRKQKELVIRTVTFVHTNTSLPMRSKYLRLKLNIQTRIGPLAHRCCVSSSSRQVKRCQPTRKERKNSRVRNGIKVKFHFVCESQVSNQNYPLDRSRSIKFESPSLRRTALLSSAFPMSSSRLLRTRTWR